MRNLERNGKLIYHTKRYLTEDGVEYFGVPVALRCNPMPISTEWSTLPVGTVDLGMKKFILSRDGLRDTIIFRAYGYDSPIEGESVYGLDVDNPYGWVEEYLTRWINDLLSGDRFYVDTLPSENYSEYTMAEGADYVVVAVEDTPNTIGVVLKRLQS